MENYTIFRPLGMGTYGKTYVVTKADCIGYNVMKVIECKDETHANEAFREALKITQINHPYIGSFVEIFVHFDPEQISFFLILIMPYYTCGNCFTILQNNWIQRKKTEEEELKKWLIQVLELLSVIHSQNVAHLNLKPENIFYDYNLEHVLLTDFGLKSIINDKQRFIRSRESDFIWSSPVIEREDDKGKNDVWTFGMIVFAYMTTSVLTENEFFHLLSSTEKYDLAKLRKLLDDQYSFDFVNLVMVMLDYNPDTRIGMQQVVGYNFYQDCFKVYSSKIVSRQNRQKITINMRPVPIEMGPGHVLLYINAEKHNEYCVQDALLWLESVVRLNIARNLPMNYAIIIVEALNINHENEDICVTAVICLNYLAMFSTDYSHFLFSNYTIETVVELLDIHPYNLRLHKVVAAFFIVLSSQSSISLRCGKLKAVEAMLKSLTKFFDKCNAVSITLNALWNLCVEPYNCEVAIKNDARHILIRIYNKHIQSPKVLLNTTASLLAIITGLDVSLDPININIVYYVLEALQLHSGYSNLVKYALVLLENLIAMNEEHGMQFIESVIDRADSPVLFGVEILKKVFAKHNDCSVIALCILNVIIKVVSYEDLIDAMLDLSKLMAFINHIIRRFKHSKRLFNCMECIINKLSSQLKYLKV